MRNLRIHAELGRILGAFETESLPIILLKGAHVGVALYGDVGLREIGDLDLMVRREHLKQATELAAKLGYESSKPFDIDVDVAVSQHVSVLTKPPFFALELHWNVTKPRSRYAIAPAELWQRADPLRIHGMSGLALSSEDLVLHLCVHAAYQHLELDVRSICDLARLVESRGSTINWDVVYGRAHSWGWTRGIDLMLHLACSQIGVALPNRARSYHRKTVIGRDVATAAALQLLAAEGSTLPRGLSTLHDYGSVLGRLRHLWRSIVMARVDLQRAYPTHSRSWIRRRMVYVLRGHDLVRRHVRTAWRLWIVRDPGLRQMIQRQQLLRSFLGT